MRSVSFIPTMILFACLFALAGCSEASSDRDAAGSDAAIEAVSAPVAKQAEADRSSDAPGFTSGAAPGVAFTYSYAFSLPSDAISDVQHRHAAA